MTEIVPTIEIPESLIVADIPVVQQLLARYAMAGASQMHVVFDFDRTLTTQKPGSDDDVTSWHILRSHLPAEGQARYDELYTMYRPLEKAETMTEADAVTWWSSILGLFVAHNVNLRQVEEEFLDRASIRPGARELFDLCQRQDIPTVILSAGTYDIIDVWCRAYGIEPSLIVSTALETDEAGTITGWAADTLVHVLNKHETDHPELNRYRSERPYGIAIGDGMKDGDMVSGAALRVRLLDLRDDELLDAPMIRQRSLEIFDAVIENGSLAPMTTLLSSMLAARQFESYVTKNGSHSG